MMRLKSKLLSLNASKTTKVKVYSPRNCEELRIPFKGDKTAKVVGKLAAVPPPSLLPGSGPDDAGAITAAPADPPLITGVLVQNDFKLSLMAPEDLREYAGLTTTTIMCKQRLRLSAAGIDLIRWALEGMFGAIEELPEMRGANKAVTTTKADADAGEDNADAAAADDALTAKQEEADEEIGSTLVAAYLVMGCITVRYHTNGEVELEWEGNMFNDSIADSVMAVLFSVESSPAAVKRSAANSKHSHSHGEEATSNGGPPHGHKPHANCSPAERLERLFWFLEAQFGADNVAPVEDPKLPAAPAPVKAEDRMAAASTADGTKKESGEDGAKKEEQEDGVKDEPAAKKEEEEDVADADAMDEDTNADSELEQRRSKEIQRLHKLGIPVPGVRIKVDKMEATVWLEDLEVECNNKVFADRVRAVMERAVEVTAPLWA